jgi:hypothetical protein
MKRKNKALLVTMLPQNNHRLKQLSTKKELKLSAE